MDDKERGKRIQQLRQEMNLSQEQLVEKLNVTVIPEAIRFRCTH